MKRTLLIAAVFVLGASLAKAQVPEKYSVGFKGGFLTSGTISIGEGEADTKTSPALKIDFDALLMEKLSMGAYLFYSPVKPDGGGDAAKLTSIGVTVKPRFILDDDITIKPGLALGYNLVDHAEMDDPSKGMNIGLQVEATKPLNDKLALVGELGFISQPSGGTPDVDVSWAPIFYITFGVELFK